MHLPVAPPGRVLGLLRRNNSELGRGRRSHPALACAAMHGREASGAGRGIGLGIGEGRFTQACALRLAFPTAGGNAGAERV